MLHLLGYCILLQYHKRSPVLMYREVQKLLSLMNPRAKISTFIPQHCQTARFPAVTNMVRFRILEIYDVKSDAYETTTVTVHPVLGDGKTGSVVLQFLYLDMQMTSAVIRIYEGVNTSGTPIVIDESNAQNYVDNIRSLQFDGPVTVTFESGGATGAVEDSRFVVQLRYITGDQVFSTPHGRLSAAWTDFIQPDSYTIVDDLQTIAFFANPSDNPNYDNVVPIVAGYFDNLRQFVSSEIVICIQYYRGPASLVPDFPGSLNFSLVKGDNHDLDDNGIYEPEVDDLIAAKLIYLLGKLGDNPSRHEALQTQLAIWCITLGMSNGFSDVSDLMVAEVISAITELRTPSEPTFSITSPSSPVLKGANQNFEINFDMEGDHPKRLKLRTSENMSITEITGDYASFNATTGVLEFSTVPAQVLVKTTSNVNQTGTLYAIYDEEEFWKVNNIALYQACDPSV